MIYVPDFLLRQYVGRSQGEGGREEAEEGVPEITIAIGGNIRYLICDATAAEPFFGDEKTQGRFYEQLDKFHEDKFEQCLAMTGKMRYNQL